MDETKPVKPVKYLPVIPAPQPGDLSLLFLVGHLAYEVQPDGTLKTLDGTVIEEGDELRAVEQPSAN